MKQLPKQCLVFLEERGIRKTRARVALLEMLSEAGAPVSVPEMLGALKRAGQSFNKTTLYRELDFLMREGVVAEATILGACRYYEIARGHHHHMICTRCQDIQDIEVDEAVCAFGKQFFYQKGFHITHHSVEFFGVCRGCGHN